MASWRTTACDRRTLLTGASVTGYFALGIDENSQKAMPPLEGRKDLFPGALEMMVLQTLQRQPRHGYALVQDIKRSSNDLLQVEEGSLYPALQRMLKAGWLTARWGLSASGRRVRIYELTAAGKRHLAREISSFERMLEGIRLVLSPARS